MAVEGIIVCLQFIWMRVWLINWLMPEQPIKKVSILIISLFALNRLFSWLTVFIHHLPILNLIDLLLTHFLPAYTVSFHRTVFILFFYKLVRRRLV